MYALLQESINSIMTHALFDRFVDRITQMESKKRLDTSWITSRRRLRRVALLKLPSTDTAMNENGNATMLNVVYLLAATTTDGIIL